MTLVSNYNGKMKLEPDPILPTPKVTLFPAHSIQLGWRKDECVGGGMINVGNTCYLNSTLQALFHVPAFVNWLRSESSHVGNCTVVNGAVNDECIICAMNKTLTASMNKRQKASKNTIIKPLLIYNRLQFICKDLVYGQQEDAHEFMCRLLESMKESYLTRYRDLKLDSYSRETTPLNQIFGGYIRTEVTCLKCGSVSTTFQHCQDLFLEIQHTSTLDGALAAYFCEERLDGDAAYCCEQCHTKVSATKKCSLEKPPQVLCIQFKRFSIMGEKINKHISFSPRLDLAKFLCPQSAHHSPAPLMYHLVSMVTHHGSSVHCGHYTAVAQTSTGQYYKFDDSLVRAVSLSAIINTNPYIMMYEREPEVPSVPQKSVVSAAATTSTCTVSGQKTSLCPHGHVSYRNGSVVNDRQGSDSNSAVYTYESSPSAKDELTSSDSMATPTCSWDMSSLGEVSPPFQHSSSKCKRPFAHKSCCPDSDATVNDMKLLEDDSELVISRIGNATDVESEGDITVRGEHVKESKNIRVSDIEELNSKQYSRKQKKKHKKKKKRKSSKTSEGDEHEGKKLKKKHKKKKKRKSTTDGSEGSKHGS
jgi:ubiquitin carboxyl-terminal hydrolase 36/42